MSPTNRRRRVALVTGGGSGIGRAVALALAADGFAVVVAGRRIQPLKSVVRAAAEAGSERIVAVVADVREEQSVKDLFAATGREFRRLDLLFNNAGISAPAVPMEDLGIEDWNAVVQTNLTGAFLCTREAVRMMKAQRPMGGRIINNGSISAHAPRPFSAPYTATKHAITGLTKATSLEGRAFKIACGQIDVGNAATELTAGLARGALQPDGRLMREPRMDVDDVARAVLYMAGLPLEANVQFMTVMATNMPYIGRG